MRRRCSDASVLLLLLFTLCRPSLLCVPFSLWKLSLLSLSLSLLQVTSVSLCVCGYVRNECVAPMSVYIVRRQLELGEAAKGSRRPPPPPHTTPPRSRVVSRAWGDSPLLPFPASIHPSPLLHLFQLLENPHHHTPTPVSQKEG